MDKIASGEATEDEILMFAGEQAMLAAGAGIGGAPKPKAKDLLGSSTKKSKRPKLGNYLR